jgi:hypothetical protein
VKTEEILLGKTIKQIDLSSDDEAIKFTLDNDEEIIAKCDGDCCSHTWIEDLLNLESVIGSPILEVYDLELPPELRHPSFVNPDGEEEMEYYGLAIKTLKGTATIAYRNSSNGYYGGSLCFEDSNFYGGVFNQNVSILDWKKVA